MDGVPVGVGVKEGVGVLLGVGVVLLVGLGVGAAATLKEADVPVYAVPPGS